MPSTRRREAEALPSTAPPLRRWLALAALPGLACGLSASAAPDPITRALGSGAALALWLDLAALAAILLWPLAARRLELRDRLRLIAALALGSLPLAAAAGTLSPLPTPRAAAALLLILAWMAPGLAAARAAEGGEARWTILGGALGLAWPGFLASLAVLRGEPASPWLRGCAPVFGARDALEFGLGAAQLLPPLLLCGFILAARFGLARLAPALALLLALSATSAPPAARAASAPFRLARARPLLGEAARSGARWPLALDLTRDAPGEWEGQVVLAIGQRRWRQRVRIPGGGASPLRIVLAPHLIDASPLELQAQAPGEAPVSLADRLPQPRLVSARAPLLFAVDAPGLDFARALLREPGFQGAQVVALEDALALRAASRWGEAFDVGCAGAPLSELRAAALQRFAAAGGLALLLGEARAALPRIAPGAGSSPLGAPIGAGLAIAGEADPGLWASRLASRLRGEARGRLPAERIFEQLDRRSRSPQRILGPRLALASLLLAASLALASAWAARADRPSRELMRLALAALLLTGLTRGLVLPRSELTLERLRLDELPLRPRRATGPELAATTSFLRVQPVMPGEPAAWTIPDAPAPWFPSPGWAAIAAEALEADGERLRLELPFERASSRLFAIHELRELRGGLWARPEGEEWVIGWEEETPLRGLLLQVGEGCAWVDALAPGEQRRVSLEARSWFEVVEGRCRAELRPLYYALARSESSSGPLRRVIAEGLEAGVGFDDGTASLEVEAARIIIAD